MKIQVNRERGIVLMTVLVTASVISVVLVSVLVWAGSHNLVTARSKCWNSALGVAEAGVEEALAQLKDHNYDRNANNWVLTNGVYQKTRTIGTGYYVVNISTGTPAVITSTGLVTAPLKSSEYIKRTVQVVTTNDPLYWAGIA